MPERQMELFPGPTLDPRTGIVKAIVDRRLDDADRARDEGIRLAALGKQKWLDEALAAVRRVAMYCRTFTADDVWDDLAGTGDDRPRDGRALGPVMQRAAREGICRWTPDLVKCGRKSRHRARITIWESLIFKQQ